MTTKDQTNGVAVSGVDLNAARDLIDAWCERYVEGMPPVTARDKLITDLLSCLQASPAPDTLQDRVAQAHVALFHDDPTDLAERRDRFYEEANETVQALGMTEEDAHKLVSYTFGRAVGDVQKEIGAAALTLASLCVVGGWDMMACAEADLAALQTPEKIAKVRAKRATRHGRGPLPGLSPAPDPVAEPVAWEDVVATEARRYASFYPEGSDGRNTFVIFAEWVDGLAQPSPKPEAVSDEDVEAIARFLCENMCLVQWDSLRDESSEDNGFPAWKVYGHYNAGKEDYRRMVRASFNAALAGGE